MKSYIFNLLIAIDQFFNVLVCNGEPDETISSAAYRMERDGRFWGRARPVIDWLFSGLEKDHCRTAYESELLRRQYAPEFQNKGT